MADNFQHVLKIKQRRFLRCFAKIGIVEVAAREAGVNSNSHRKWLKNDPIYKEAFEIARDMACDVLEEICVERAKKSSDLLMIFMLKALRPEKYRELKAIQGDPNNPIKHEMIINVRREELPEPKYKLLDITSEIENASTNS